MTYLTALAIWIAINAAFAGGMWLIRRSSSRPEISNGRISAELVNEEERARFRV